MAKMEKNKEKYVNINKETLPKLREALGNLMNFNDLSNETIILATDIVVYIAQEIEKGSMYKVARLEEEEGYHLDDVTLVVSPEGNPETLVSFFAFLAKTIIAVKKEADYNINDVTPELLSKVLKDAKIL